MMVNMAHHPLAQSVQVLLESLLGEHSRSEQFQRLKEEQDRFLKEMNVYKI